MEVRSALVFTLLVGCASSQPRAVEIRRVDGGVVRPVALSTRGAHVRFEGNEVVTRAELLEVIREDDAERDAARLTRAYYERGYIVARVEGPFIERGVTTYRIQEGERFRIGKIAARDVDADGAPISPPDGVPTRAHLRAQSGDWFRLSVWADDLRAVRALYQDVGYPCVETPLETSVDAQHHVVDVTIAKIHLGPRVTIDRVDVVAPSEDVAARVRRSIGVAKGELFNASKLETERKRVLATGAWARVDLSYDVDLGAGALERTKATIRYELVPR